MRKTGLSLLFNILGDVRKQRPLFFFALSARPSAWIVMAEVKKTRSLLLDAPSALRQAVCKFLRVKVQEVRVPPCARICKMRGRLLSPVLLLLRLPTFRDLLHLPTSRANFSRETPPANCSCSRVTSPSNFSCQLFRE